MTCITSTHSHKNHRSCNNIKQLFFNIINLSQLYNCAKLALFFFPHSHFLTLHYKYKPHFIMTQWFQWFCSVCEHDGSFISNNLLSCTKDHVDQPSKHAHPRRLIKYCTPALGGFKYMASHVHPHKA